MDNKDLKNIDTTAKFSNFQVLNPDFVRCKCNVMYIGKNRNYTDITSDALQKFIKRKGYANIPVVGHIKPSSKNGKAVMGSHDRKIEITDGDIQEINECTAYGVIPLDANPRMEKIVDIHGIEKEYFTVDVILWTHYFPELMETSYSDEVYFNQSMEIAILDYEYDSQYMVIKDFSLQALCMLGKYDGSHGNGDISDNSEPCFEESRIRRFSLDESKFKENYELLLENLKKYSTNNKETKMEDNKNMTEKVFELLSAVTFKCNDADVAKYAILSITDTEANVIDKEDGYKAYSIPYTVTEVAEGEEVTNEVALDYESKVEKSVGVMDKVENDFSIKAEIDATASVAIADAVTTALENFESTAVTEMTEKYEKLEAEFNTMKSEFDAAQAKLDVFEAEKKEAEIKLHEKEIDDVIETYSAKMGTYADYLLYRSKVDYSKTKEQVNTDMLILLGKANMGQKSTFSFNPVITGAPKDSSFESDNGNGRYGDLFDKINK